MINAWSEKNLFALFKNIVFLSSTVRTNTWEKDQLTFWYWERKINTSFDANWRKRRKVRLLQMVERSLLKLLPTFISDRLFLLLFGCQRRKFTHLRRQLTQRWRIFTLFNVLFRNCDAFYSNVMVIKLCILKHFTQYDPFKHIFYAFKRPSDAFKVTCDALCSTGDVFNQSNTCH